MKDEIVGLNNIIKGMKAENDELKQRLSVASQGVPPLPGKSRNLSPSPDAIEARIAKLVEEKFNHELQKGRLSQQAVATRENTAA